jgi:RNA polymerase sigma factor (TIGR02999 family)
VESGEDDQRVLKLSREEDGEEAFPRMYDQLRRLAAQYLSRERSGHTLQPTAVVHEVWLRFSSAASPPREDDVGGFLSAASRVIRQILVDHARKRGRQRRGSGWSRVTLEEGILTKASPMVDLLDLEDAMTRLEQRDDRLCRVVELRFFCGLTHEEIARELGLTPSIVQADWQLARAWLRRELNRGAR